MPATASPELQAVELFSSLQGEGVWIGARQIFFRLAYCNLACGYCDTDFAATPQCRIETRPGSGKFVLQDNPLNLPSLLAVIDRWLRECPGLHQAINLTGGEPLCQASALTGWLPELRRRLPIHLETNGTCPAELEMLLPWLDFISLDIKLEAVTGQPTPWAEHRACLKLASQLSGQVKCVVDAATPVTDIEQAARLLAELAPDIPLILQPVTVANRPAVAGGRLMKHQLAASRFHAQVRIIPQVHPLLEVL
ncbi:MAG TPA: 7-carboxy-7-deazaguanine synthase QueE [Geothermobacteraceae bacterium]|nr:7-carboxy-7-deazaguanine synthase QueE [Geothermobacteraceae bacterium]